MGNFDYKSKYRLNLEKDLEQRIKVQGKKKEKWREKETSREGASNLHHSSNLSPTTIHVAPKLSVLPLPNIE